MNRLTRQAGYTLIELCVCVAVIGILLGKALPAVSELKQRHQLQTLAQTLMVDLQQARSEAVHRTSAVQLRFSQHAKGSCYLMHTGAAGQCRCEEGGTPVCTAAAELIKLEWVAAERNLQIRSNVASMSFQARQGAVTSTGSIDISNAHGKVIRHIVSIAGRVRSCTPSANMGGFAACQG